MRLPRPAARASQASRMGAKLSLRQTSYHWAKPVASTEPEAPLLREPLNLTSRQWSPVELTAKALVESGRMTASVAPGQPG